MYAFASVPIWNSESTIVGPLVRIAVFSSWIGVARTLSQAQKSFSKRNGLIGGSVAIPFALVAAGAALSMLVESQSAPSALTVFFAVLAGFCSIAAYSFICGLFATVPTSVPGALFLSGMVLVVQLIVDCVLIGFRVYGPYHHLGLM
jgi:hypothetical protein